jgi:Family of unknown function (DUF5302)
MSEKSDNPSKAKFLEALEKKKKTNNARNDTTSSGSKVLGGQSTGNAPKMFRRKSGSA